VREPEEGGERERGEERCQRGEKARVIEGRKGGQGEVGGKGRRGRNEAEKPSLAAVRERRGRKKGLIPSGRETNRGGKGRAKIRKE